MEVRRSIPKAGMLAILGLLGILAMPALAPALRTHPSGWSRLFYAAYRTHVRAAFAARQDFLTRDDQHFILKYTRADAAVAGAVLRQADLAYDRVTKDLDYSPPGKVVLVLYPDRASLQRSFGWSSQDQALGVYWAGVIRLLSPRVWLPTGDERQLEAAYGREGPVTHEFTHLVLDYRTDGNYPYWFTEGLAQWEEYRYTGYLWLEPQSRLDQPLYSVAELSTSFPALPNQALAYREAFLLVRMLDGEEGDGGLQRLVGLLAKGVSWDEALDEVYGMAPAGLQKRFTDYLARPGSGGED